MDFYVHHVKEFDGIRQDLSLERMGSENGLRECIGLDPSEKQGALVRHFTWEESETITGITGDVKKGISYVFGYPDGPQEVKVIASYDSSIEQWFLYCNPWWDGTQWQHEWKNLTTFRNWYPVYAIAWSLSFVGTVKDWFVRDAVLRIGMGTEHTRDYPLWFGYVDRKYFPEYDADAGSSGYLDEIGYNGMLLSIAPLLAPDYPMVKVIATAEGQLGYKKRRLLAGEYQVALSYVYDGYQEGPLGTRVGDSDTKVVVTVGTTFKRLVIDIYHIHDVANSTPADYRVTDINVYLKYTPEEGVSAIPFDWTHIMTLPITSSAEKIEGDIERPGGWVDDGYTVWPPQNYKAYKCSVYVNNIENLTGMTYWASAGHDCDKRYILANYDRIGAAAGQVYIGNIRRLTSDEFSVADEDSEYDYSVCYAPRQGNGKIAPDLFPPLKSVGTEREAGEGPIMGIVQAAGRGTIIREHSVAPLKVSQIVDTYIRPADIHFGVGAIAENSIVQVASAVIFADVEGIWFYDGLEPRLISDRIKDWWDGFTLNQKKSAFATYFPQKKQYMITVVKQSADTMVYSLITGRWFQTKILDELQYYFTGSDENLYSIVLTEAGDNKLYIPHTDPAGGVQQTVRFYTGNMNFGFPQMKKRYRKITWIYGGSNLKTYVYVDGSEIEGTPVGGFVLPDHLSAETYDLMLHRPLGKNIAIKGWSTDGSYCEFPLYLGIKYERLKI